ncbi:hypothetical protein AB7813_05445 [Tardiphaga sp. 20_F10_N6_6]
MAPITGERFRPKDASNNGRTEEFAVPVEMSIMRDAPRIRTVENIAH